MTTVARRATDSGTHDGRPPYSEGGRRHAVSRRSRRCSAARRVAPRYVRHSFSVRSRPAIRQASSNWCSGSMSHTRTPSGIDSASLQTIGSEHAGCEGLGVGTEGLADANCPSVRRRARRFRRRPSREGSRRHGSAMGRETTCRAGDGAHASERLGLVATHAVVLHRRSGRRRRAGRELPIQLGSSKRTR